MKKNVVYLKFILIIVLLQSYEHLIQIEQTATKNAEEIMRERAKRLREKIA